jgi:hypothetical protein
MKPRLLIALAALALSSCASTQLWDANGHRIARFESNLTNVEYSGNGVTFRASTMDNSTATTAQKAGAQGIVTAAGAAVAVSGLTALLP